MDSWPVDERTQPVAAETGKKRQTKSKQTATAPNYPDLERGANAVTLVEREGQLEWAAIAKSGQQGRNHLRMGRYSAIFPVTRPMLDRQTKTTILHQAERGANFLRTFLPEVDIPAELIREEVARDAETAQKLELYDPYMGNLLEPVVTTDSTFLAFPMGELNRDLNLSPFLQAGNGAVFKPSGRPTRTFDTPIRQISASQSPGQSSYLAVRTFGLTSLLEVNTSKTTPYLAEMATILHADTDNRALVDIRLSVQPFEALAVTDHGSVYRCSVFSGQKNLNVIHSRNLNADGDTQDSFWRLGLGVHGVNYFLASKHSLTQFDLRTNDFQRLFSLPGQRDVLTYVEDQGDDYIVKLCSTREILWIDARFPGKPLLSYKHGRQYDRYLEVWTSPLSPASTLLTSRSNAMVTVYDVSRSEGQLIHLDAPPYCFIPGNDARASHLGQAIFKNPLDTNPEAFSLIRLSEQGSLSQVDFRTSAAHPASVFETSWTTDVKRLESKPLHTKAALSEDQKFIETNLSSAYDHIFQGNGQEREKAEEKHANAVYDLLETIPRFWQEVGAPVEHMLTTSDVVFRAGDEPIQATRADFLTESVINSTRGYRAMVQGRLSPTELVKGTAWHYNIAPILQRFDPTFAADIQNCTKALSQHDLAEDPARSAQSLRYEKEAREQLALDLALSADVFSSQPFSKSSDEDLELETMTKTLSLGGEPPAVEFGYLRPQASDHYNKEKEKHEVVLSMGVRSLLKDWEIGADPEDFIFADHYDENAPASQQTRRVRPIQKAENISQLAGTQSQRPPVILAASTVPARPPEIGRRMLAAQSHNTVVVPPRMVGSGSQVPLSNVPQSSQEYMTSTQILPGVHGGRPPMPKKKVGKKRIGGF